MSGTIAFSAEDVQIELRDRGEPLVRLFRHPGSAFQMPPEQYRTNRYDPPPGNESKFAVLYTADNIAAAAMETRVLHVSPYDEYSYTERRAQPYKVVRLQYGRPALFIRMDSSAFRTKLGIPRFTGADYLPFRRAALALFERYGETVDGYSWESFHRGQPGRNYGFWHHRKSVIDLQPLQQEADCHELLKDSEWLSMLAVNPVIELRPDDDPGGATPKTTPGAS